MNEPTVEHIGDIADQLLIQRESAEWRDHQPLTRFEALKIACEIWRLQSMYSIHSTVGPSPPSDLARY